MKLSAEDVCEEMIPKLRGSAIAARDKLRKYLPGLRSNLQHTLRYSPKVQPAMPVPALDTQDAMQQFFGCLPEHVEGIQSIGLLEAWASYCEVWPALPAEKKALPAAKFWCDSDVLKAIKFSKRLAPLGRWHGDKPTSNVQCERVFSIMRNMEAHARLCMGPKSLEQQLMARVNKWVMKQLVAPTIEGRLLFDGDDA